MKYIEMCNGLVEKSSCCFSDRTWAISNSPVSNTLPKAAMTDMNVFTFGSLSK